MWSRIKSFLTGRKPAYMKFAKNSYEVWHCKEYGM